VRPSRDSKRKVSVKFLIDSGAVYSLVPARILRKLGLRPYREVTFSLADGTTVTRQVGDAYFEINGSLGPAPVMFGEEGDEPLLGAMTLESLGMVLDPFKRRLIRCAWYPPDDLVLMAPRVCGPDRCPGIRCSTMPRVPSRRAATIRGR
jgi:clan AA aspartic protease